MQSVVCHPADDISGLPSETVGSGKVAQMPLEIEMETYRRELPNLLANAGKFVVIGGDQVVGTYDTYDDALKIGYERFSLKPFLVKQIAMSERVHFFTRDIGPQCHT